MEVILLKTPEYEYEKFREVCELLNSFEGIINFTPSNYEFDKENFYFLNYELFPDHNFIIPSNNYVIKFDPEKGKPLSWTELFSLCSFYREIFNVDDESFVVLLTKRKNALNWFSASDDHKNIFVHTAEWDLFTTVNEKYPIAYQIMENIMQSLMKIDLTDTPNQYVHDPIKGCMNDFCMNKSQILIKLQTANICPDCIQKVRDEEIKDEILDQTLTIFNGIRNEFIFQQEPQIEMEPTSLIVEHNGKIILPVHQLEIRFPPLFKTLYLFFLSKSEGVSLAELSDFKEELLSIYRGLRPSASLEDAESRINNLSDPFGDGFNPVKSHINRIITELLGEHLAEFYRISGTATNPYYIKIPRDLVDIRY